MGSIVRILDRVRPDEVYNLAAQSFVAVSFDQPVATGNITGLGAVLDKLNSSFNFFLKLQSTNWLPPQLREMRRELNILAFKIYEKEFEF